MKRPSFVHLSIVLVILAALLAGHQQSRATQTFCRLAPGRRAA